MSPGMSVFLDLVRFLAAVTVVLSHMLGPEFSTFGFKGSAGLGVFAVGIFFVLSGYVIVFTIDKTNPSLREYLCARLGRIYSVLVPGLILTYALRALGMGIFPAAYRSYGQISMGLGALPKTVFSCLTFLNQTQFLRASPPTNGPIWSLGFEVPYYLFFAALMFAPKYFKYGLLVVGAIVWGFPVVFLFPAWLGGVGLYRWIKTHHVSKVAGTLCLVALPFILLVTVKANSEWLRFSGRLHPTSEFAKAILELAGTRAGGFPLLYGGSATMLCLVLAAHSFSNVLDPSLLILQKPIRIVASSTFSIYLFHFPLLCLVCATPLYHRDSRFDFCVAFLVVVGLSFGLSRVTEAKKSVWHSWLVRSIPMAKVARNQ
jgi:peptidoglycan/LPS O-acetylase OafA/YrhL